MEPLTIGLIGISCMMLLLILRMPIGLGLAVVGFLGFSLLSTGTAGFSMLAMVAYKTGASYTLTVIPLFILMGQFATHSRMGFELSGGLPVDRRSSRGVGNGQHSGLCRFRGHFRIVHGYRCNLGNGRPAGNEALQI
jgi:uncharacterized membrane protein